MSPTYQKDIVAWASEQAALLRAGKLSEIDIENIAEEIEGVGKSEQRGLASRIAVLLAHLLKWKSQPHMRSASWEATIRDQRTMIDKRLKKTPSLKPILTDDDWIAEMWGDARQDAGKETGLGYAFFPRECPWPLEQALDPSFWPD